MALQESDVRHRIINAEEVVQTLTQTAVLYT